MEKIREDHIHQVEERTVFKTNEVNHSVLRNLVMLMTLVALSLSLFGCSNSSGTTNSSNAVDESVMRSLDSGATYEGILDEYTEKLEAAAPILVDEYEAEAESQRGNVSALSVLCTEKIDKLAEINTEGLEKLAGIRQRKGDSEETYDDWAAKLNSVYMVESQRLNDAYLDSVSD